MPLGDAGSRNVLLIGMRAAGKTSLGRSLARRQGCPFVDLDEELGRRCGKDANQLLAEEGEPAFRRQEALVLAWAASLSGTVIATGGGAVLHAEAFAALARTGVVVYLSLPVEELARRARARPRPALTGWGPEEEVRGLFEAREPLYRRVADFTIQAMDADPILDLLNALREPGRPRDTPCSPPDAPPSR